MRVMTRAGFVLAMLSVAACGGIGNKQDAAAAAQRVAMAGQGAQARSPLFAEGLGEANLEFNVPGESGSAKVSMQSSAGGSGANVTFTIAYDMFSPDGENTFDGSMTYTVKSDVDLSGGSATTEVTMKGVVTMTGEYDAELDMDVTQKIATTAMASGGSVSVTMDGYIKADGTEYTYANESIEISVSAK